MPKGVPKTGYRVRGPNKATLLKGVKPTGSKMVKLKEVPAVHVPYETDAQIEARLADRFDIVDAMTRMAVRGDARSLIVSGPAGVGKSYVVEGALKSCRNHTIIKGYVRPTGLFKLLWQHRKPNSVLVFDDSDEVFTDDTSLTLLKAVCDSSERRRVSYMTEGVLVDDETGERIPKNFDFEGTIIFITNYDFDDLINRGHRLAPHFQALVSRSHYIDLAMKTARHYIVRIRQVIKAGLLKNIGLDAAGQIDVIDFLEENHKELRELSLRMALKIGSIRRGGRSDWKKMAKVSCCRNV